MQSPVISAKDRLVWIDLEMSGLDASVDAILEIAVIVTDNNLTPQDEGLSLIIHQPENVFAAMSEWCTTHHTKSGLLDASRNSTISLEQAELQVYEYIQRWCEPQKAPLCGNSIYQDKAFLRRWMPRVHAYLHYRIIDVSSLKELIKRWYPKNPHAHSTKQDTHRALADIHESIAELQQYRTYFFKDTL